MLKNDSDFADPAVLVLAPKNTMSNTPVSNAPMSDAAIEKAALAITKLEGRKNWIRSSANTEMVLDHTWEFFEGGRTSPLISKVGLLVFCSSDGGKPEDRKSVV